MTLCTEPPPPCPLQAPQDKSTGAQALLDRNEEQGGWMELGALGGWEEAVKNMSRGGREWGQGTSQDFKPSSERLLC